VCAFADQSLRSCVSGYDSVQYHKKETRIVSPQWQYVLMPVWTMTYRDPKTEKICYFACNGQTGNVCGEIVRVSKDAVYVACGQGLLKINELQLQGKKRMDTAAFLRGYRLEEGSIFQ